MKSKSFAKSLLLLLFFIFLASSNQLYSRGIWGIYHKDTQNIKISNPKDFGSVVIIDQNLKIDSQRWSKNASYTRLNNPQLGHVIHLIGFDKILILNVENGSSANIQIALPPNSKYSAKLFNKNGQTQDLSGQIQKLYSINTGSTLVLSESGNLPNLQESIDQIKSENQEMIKQFMAANSIQPKYAQFVGKAFRDTLSSICVMQTQFDRYFGLCYDKWEGKIGRKPQHEIDIRYSPLIIDLLFGYDQQLALWLFENLFSYIEERMFYREEPFVQVPQHIEVIRGYLAIQKMINKNEADSHKSKSKITPTMALHEKIKSVLNGYINQMLLSDVNTLEQEINYRENKKVHPTLLRMLTLNWKPISLKHSLSSFYDQSFTPDYYYHSADQKPENIVGKISWLIKCVVEYSYIVKGVSQGDEIKAMEQVYSLAKILLGFATDDQYAKQGKFYSIIRSGGNRLYATQIGYQSFLPYIYQFSSVVPMEMLLNVTRTPFGISSLNLEHPKASPKFEFRGNIHLYFNSKILDKMIVMLKGREKEVKEITDIWKRVRATIQKNAGLDENGQQTLDAFTMWDSNGKGVRNRKSITLLNAMFLRQKL